MRPLRVWLVGFGMVGRWLVRALDSDAAPLRARYGLEPAVVGVATARDGFVYDEAGLGLKSLAALAAAGGSLGALTAARRFPTALDGLRATEADVLVEVTASPREAGEPGRSHMLEALRRGIPVVTSNKWPVALAGLELAELAKSRGVQFRAESTVMSGTPVLSALVDGLAGAVPLELRGVLNATANFILTRMAEGARYEDALAEAQAAGLAERDPAADVEGGDTVAKLMILSALVFGRQLRPADVACRGITDVEAEVEAAALHGRRLKHVASIDFSGPALVARVQPEALDRQDPLARVDGTANAVVCTARPLGEVAISGPGAGPELAGQGALSDLIAVAAHVRNRLGE